MTRGWMMRSWTTKSSYPLKTDPGGGSASGTTSSVMANWAVLSRLAEPARFWPGGRGGRGGDSRGLGAIGGRVCRPFKRAISSRSCWIVSCCCWMRSRSLRDLIQQQQETIQQLRDEIARLKGLQTRPPIAPSPLESPPRPPRPPGQKRAGSAKRLKTAQLAMTDEVVPLAEPPPGSVFKGYEDFVVQDLIIHPRVIRYRRERWQAPDGQNLVAELPPDIRPDSHFGPTLIAFIIHQYHHQHVTQPLLWEQLDQLGIDISTGQLSRIVTEGKDAFHQEKAELLPAGLAVSTDVQVDDTGARHRGHNGSCLHLGNELFAYFESTDSKS